MKVRILTPRQEWELMAFGFACSEITPTGLKPVSAEEFFKYDPPMPITKVVPVDMLIKYSLEEILRWVYGKQG